MTALGRWVERQDPTTWSDVKRVSMIGLILTILLAPIVLLQELAALLERQGGTGWTVAAGFVALFALIYDVALMWAIVKTLWEVIRESRRESRSRALAGECGGGDVPPPGPGNGLGSGKASGVSLMPLANSESMRYRCQTCLHKHYFTKGKTFTLKEGKRVVAQETNYGSWGQCEDPECSCISLHRLNLNQLEILLDKAEEALGRPIGHRPPGVEVPSG